ncbi:calreticulin-like [Hyla sarda]|uniref:calreticulin-like n=1 Tax=Hyla sarda TaxID=327740 RepID=UPI0024C225BC|nr:calreticulin-like [Hyla sarda]XP_056388236.1 calreticulin-like [Hyla sarda]XP_056388237.1 calreticulin-like [Hyla sarda]
MNWRLILAACVMAVSAEPIIYFREQFEDGDEWQKRWVESKNKSDYGKWQLTAGKFFGDPEKDKGIQTTQDWKNYALSARFEPISNENQTLVIQFTVKHEQAIDCGGGYVKIYPADINQEQINSESVYCIMFGPDICGTIHEKVHVIFSYKEKYHLITKNITCKHDELTHLYTLVIRPNNTYTVKIDNEVVANGTLEDDWDFLLPRQIIDENATKPADWDDRVQIEDPDAQRPEDWDEREFIPDPESKQPRDWDSSMDGEWEPPMIPNSKYTGIWKPKIIDNPNYQGEWTQPYIDNPDYVPDDTLYRYDELGVIGLDLWQVKSGTIFDNFLITNDEELAETIGNETWGETREPESKMKTIQDEERDAKDEKKQRWKKLEQELAKLDEMERQEKERKSKLRKTLRKQYGLDPSPEQAQLPQPPPPPKDEL